MPCGAQLPTPGAIQADPLLLFWAHRANALRQLHQIPALSPTSMTMVAS